MDAEGTGGAPKGIGKGKCPLCQGPTAPCYLIDSQGSYQVTCHGMTKNVWGTSVHQCAVSTRVCVVCGYISAFAETPGIFQSEVTETRAVAGLPIPVDTALSAGEEVRPDETR